MIGQRGNSWTTGRGAPGPAGMWGRRGVIAYDLIAALVILMLVGLVVSLTLHQVRRGTRAMTDLRAATRQAEATLFTYGQRPVGLDEKRITYSRLVRVDGLSDSRDPLQWTRCDVVVGSAEVGLIALTPAEGLPGEPLDAAEKAPAYRVVEFAEGDD